MGKHKTSKYDYRNNLRKICQSHYIIRQICDIKIKMQICDNEIVMSSMVINVSVNYTNNI